MFTAAYPIEKKDNGAFMQWCFHSDKRFESTMSKAKLQKSPSSRRKVKRGRKPLFSIMAMVPMMIRKMCHKMLKRALKKRRIAKIGVQLNIDAFFCKGDSIETISVHKEAQSLKNLEGDGSGRVQINVHAQPASKDFGDCMLSAQQRKTRGVHLAGHYDRRKGCFLFQQSGHKCEEVPSDTIVGIISTEVAGVSNGTIEFAMLNGCETEEMGLQLRRAGLRHVVCWRSEVQDTTAHDFAVNFYKSLSLQEPTQAPDFERAFTRAVARMGGAAGASASRAPQRHLGSGAVDFVCLLSENGDKYPSSGHSRS